MASRAGRLKERGGGERHAPAKPRLVAVLRSKLRFTCFLQVPTGSHCLSRSPILQAIGMPAYFSSPLASSGGLPLSFSVSPKL